MSTTKLRWGIVGCANVARGALIPAVQASERGTVTAIASRNIDKARRWAEELNIPRYYGSYEELLADREVDAVYIPLPNHLHREWTIRAAQAGKHVLCEKPLALTAAEAEEMIKACAEAGVLLAEAFMYRHHPRYDRIFEVIRSGEIGDVRGIHAVFTFNNAEDYDNVRVKKAWGGGALYDVGCYPISAARFILGEEPEAATVHAHFSPAHDNVDMMASGLLEFSNGVALTFDCGMWTYFRNSMTIVGSKGQIEVPNAFVGANVPFYISVDGHRREEPVPEVNQYSLQVDDFAASVLDGAPLKFAPSDAIGNMRALDACLQAAESRQRIVIGGVTI